MTDNNNSSLNDLAENLINELDRKKIFPPSYNNPEELINPSKNRSKGPPRPPNGFLLCRKNVHKEARLKGTCNMRVISKVTGMLWRSASTEEKETYEKLSVQVNNLHSQRYPGYKYRPTTRPKPQPYIVPTIPTLQTHAIQQQQQQQIHIIYSMYPIPDVFQTPPFTQKDFALLSYYLSP